MLRLLYSERGNLSLNSDSVVSWPSDFWPHLKMMRSYIEIFGYRIVGKWHITQMTHHTNDTSLKTQTSVRFTRCGRKEVSLCQMYSVFIHTLPNRTLNHYVLILPTWKKPAFNLLCLWQKINSHVQSWQLTYDSVMLLLCFALHVNLSHRSSCRMWPVQYGRCKSSKGILCLRQWDLLFFRQRQQVLSNLWCTYTTLSGVTYQKTVFSKAELGLQTRMSFCNW